MRQLSLFEEENKAITHIAGFTSLVKASMNSAAAASPYSRQQILERMNRLAPNKDRIVICLLVTKAQSYYLV